MRRALYVGALFSIFVTNGLAQVSGSFLGIVTDSSGAVAPGARVEFQDAQRNTVKKTTTGPDGGYSLPYMLPSEYTVRVNAAGFKTFERTSVSLQLGATVRVDATLEVGNLTDTVTVTQSAPLLQTDRSDVQRVIEQKGITDLPRLGRNYQTALLLIPGAQIPAQYWSPENAFNLINANGNQDTAMNGLTTSANSFLAEICNSPMASGGGMMVVAENTLSHSFRQLRVWTAGGSKPPAGAIENQSAASTR